MSIPYSPRYMRGGMGRPYAINPYQSPARVIPHADMSLTQGDPANAQKLSAENKAGIMRGQQQYNDTVAKDQAIKDKDDSQFLSRQAPLLAKEAARKAAQAAVGIDKNASASTALTQLGGSPNQIGATGQDINQQVTGALQSAQAAKEGETNATNQNAYNTGANSVSPVNPYSNQNNLQEKNDASPIPPGSGAAQKPIPPDSDEPPQSNGNPGFRVTSPTVQPFPSQVVKKGKQ